jgi:hypothetical protein
MEGRGRECVARPARWPTTQSTQSGQGLTGSHTYCASCVSAGSAGSQKGAWGQQAVNICPDHGPLEHTRPCVSPYKHAGRPYADGLHSGQDGGAGALVACIVAGLQAVLYGGEGVAVGCWDLNANSKGLGLLYTPRAGRGASTLNSHTACQRRHSVGYSSHLAIEAKQPPRGYGSIQLKRTPLGYGQAADICTEVQQPTW